MFTRIESNPGVLGGEANQGKWWVAAHTHKIRRDP